MFTGFRKLSSIFAWRNKYKECDKYRVFSKRGDVSHLSNTITLFLGLLVFLFFLKKPQPDKFGNYLVNAALRQADNKTSVPPEEELKIHSLPAKNTKTQLFRSANCV